MREKHKIRKMEEKEIEARKIISTGLKFKVKKRMSLTLKKPLMKTKAME